MSLCCAGAGRSLCDGVLGLLRAALVEAPSRPSARELEALAVQLLAEQGGGPEAAAVRAGGVRRGKGRRV